MESNGCVQRDDHILGHLRAHMLQRRHGGSCVEGTHLRLHDALVNSHLPVSKPAGGMCGLDIEGRHGYDRTAPIQKPPAAPPQKASEMRSLVLAGSGLMSKFCPRLTLAYALAACSVRMAALLYSLFTAFRSGQRAHAPADIDKSPLQILVPGSTHDGCTRSLFRSCGPCQLPGQRTKHSGEDSITSKFNACGNGGVKRCRGYNNIPGKRVAVGILLFQHRCNLASAFKLVRALTGPDHVGGEAGAS